MTTTAWVNMPLGDQPPRKYINAMSEIRVQLTPEFKGGTVVLLAMDADGLDAWRSALARAEQNVGALSTLIHAGMIHKFAIKGEESSVDLQDKQVTWQFSRSKSGEILEKLDTMKASLVPCHHYVDISAPVETL